MNMMAVTYSGNPSKPEWGHITGNKKFKYSTIVAIYPYRLPRLNYEGLTIDLPSKKKQWTGLIFLKEEEANAVINILKEQMGDLWYEKYKGKNPERVT